MYRCPRLPPCTPGETLLQCPLLTCSIKSKGYEPINDSVPYSEIPKIVDVPNLLGRGTIHPHTLGNRGKVLAKDLPTGSSSVREGIKPLVGKEDQTWYTNRLDAAAKNTDAPEGTLTFFRPGQIRTHPDQKSILPEERRFLSGEAIGYPPVGANPVGTFLRRDVTVPPSKDVYTPLVPIKGSPVHDSISDMKNVETYAKVWAEATQLGYEPLAYHRIKTIHPGLLDAVENGTLDVPTLVRSVKERSYAATNFKDEVSRDNHNRRLQHLLKLEQAWLEGNKPDVMRYLAEIL